MTDPEEMTLEELREEFREVREEMDPFAPYDEQPELSDRRRELWREIHDRTDVGPPKCKECGERRWSQATGEPVVCDGCGYAAGSATETAVHDAWDRMLGGESADD